MMTEMDVFEVLKYRIVVSDDGDTRYFNADGRLHRETGPAAIWSDGSKFWFQNGLRHRTDGPAVEYASGDKVWYINGKRLTEAEFNQRVKLL